jgi:hypothetical protein
MHHLEQLIASWKDSVSRAGTFTPDDVSELERHLRDSISDLELRGLNQEEAFLVARRRIGDISLVASEYQKVNPGLAWARRWYWMAAGFLVFSVLIQGIEALSYAAAWLALPTAAAASGLLVIAAVCYIAAALGMVRSATTPGGRAARTLQGAAAWIERHPLLTAVLGFGSLVGLRFANGIAKGALWTELGEAALNLGLFSALVTTAIPILFFLLGRYVQPTDQHAATMGAA